MQYYSSIISALAVIAAATAILLLQHQKKATTRADAVMAEAQTFVHDSTVQTHTRNNRVTPMSSQAQSHTRLNLSELQQLLQQSTTDPQAYAKLLGSLKVDYGVNEDLLDNRELVTTALASLMENAKHQAVLSNDSEYLNARHQTKQAFTALKTAIQTLANQPPLSPNAQDLYGHFTNEVAAAIDIDGFNDDGTGYYPADRIKLLFNYNNLDLPYASQRNLYLLTAHIAQGEETESLQKTGEASICEAIQTGTTHLPFCMHINRNHFVAGSLYKLGDDWHVMIIDPLSPGSDAPSKSADYITKTLQNLGIAHHQIHLHERYDVFSADESTSLQGDLYNCGPWSVALLNALTEDACHEIASDASPNSLNSLVSQVASAAIGGHDIHPWTNERSRLAGEGLRQSQYQSMQKHVDRTCEEIQQNYASGSRPS